MLLTGTLANGQTLSGRTQILDAKLGDGHVVMFAIRFSPFSQRDHRVNGGRAPRRQIARGQ